MDRNLWHISYEAGILEDPWFDPSTPENRSMFKLTTDPMLAPDEPQYIELDDLKMVIVWQLMGKKETRQRSSGHLMPSLAYTELGGST